MNTGHLGVYGLTQSGKSTWVKKKLIPSCTRVLAVDTNSEYSKFSRTAGPLHERGKTVDLAKYPHKLLEPNLSLALEPTSPDRRYAAGLVELICRLLVRLSQDESTYSLPQLTLILDEAGDYADLCKEHLSTLALRGATHLNVRLVVVSQRPNLVPATVRGNLGELVCFKLVEPLDVKAVSERTDKTFAERVKRLELRKCITWRATGTTDSPEQPAPPADLGTQVTHGP